MASSANINALNQRLRSSPEYISWMQTQGIDPSQPIQLSDQQRRAFAAYLRTRGWSIPQGAEIDPAGNINENEGLGKQAKRWGPVVGAGAVTAFGIPGLFPGLLTKGGAAAAGAAGGAGGALPTSSYYTNLGIQAGMRGAPSAMASMAGPAAAAGGGNIFSRIGGGLRNMATGGGNGGMNAWQAAALAALAGLPAVFANRGMSDEERGIYGQLTRDLDEARGDRESDRTLRDLQLRRIQYQNPLYESVSRLAMNRLPMNVQRPMGDL